jgi:GAF domain-containing protein
MPLGIFGAGFYLVKSFRDGVRGDIQSHGPKRGSWAAMRWLNAGVSYCFTAIFAFEGDSLHNICLIDKEDPKITPCADQPILESYCAYIHRSRARFGFENSVADVRVEGHPKQQRYQSCYGIPLVAADGKLLGTVCHFDRSPMPVSDAVATGLDDLALLITEAHFPKNTYISPFPVFVGR